MKHIKLYNETLENDSLRSLVRDIIDTLKLDPDAIEEADPEMIDYISNIIKDWKNKN